MNKFDQTVDIVSMADECYSVNISWYIVMLSSNIITRLYLLFVFDKCIQDNAVVAKNICDIAAILILLVAASSVQSKVMVESLLLWNRLYY